MAQVFVSNSVSIFHLPVLRSRGISKIFWILSLIWLIFLLVLYVFQANSIIAKDRLLQYYQKKLNEVSRENENLTINLAKMNSLANLEKKVEELGFEKVDKIHYLQILEDEFVIK